MGYPFLLGDNRNRIWIPLDQPVARLYLGTIIDQQPRAVRDPVSCLLASLGEQDDFAVPAHDNGHSSGVYDDVAVLDLDGGVESGLDRGLFCASLSGTTDVEGAHRQLSAGLANRLSSDDADRFAHIHNRAARQITAIAIATHADARFAGQDGADRYRADPGPLDLINPILID